MVTYAASERGQGVHSMWHPTDLDYDGPWEQFLAAPFFNAPDYLPAQVESMAVIGLAAGTVARQATAVYGPIAIDGYEIDPEIIETGRLYFDMDLPNLNAIARTGGWACSAATSATRLSEWMPTAHPTSPGI